MSQTVDVDCTRVVIDVSKSEVPKESVESLEISYVLAADGCKPVEGVLILSSDEIWSAYETVLHDK
jgi:hypothetical protein